MKKTTGMDRSITGKWRPATQAVRGGTWRSEHGETSEALFLTSGYTYDDAQTVADRFAGEDAGMTYSRLQNPTVAMLEERIALMEGAEACRAQASGMAAMTTAPWSSPAPLPFDDATGCASRPASRSCNAPANAVLACLSGTRSWGRFGPARLGSTAPRSAPCAPSSALAMTSLPSESL